mgnify:CR=1 FL=1
MQNGTIIVLAWPEGMVKNADSWYDFFLSKNGMYRVGHSAIILINNELESINYFDTTGTNSVSNASLIPTNPVLVMRILSVIEPWEGEVLKTNWPSSLLVVSEPASTCMSATLVPSQLKSTYASSPPADVLPLSNESLV